MKKFLTLMLMLVTFVIAETQLSEPKPSMMNPRKFIFPITSADEEEISHVLSSVSNVVKFYGVDKCEVVVVAYAKGIKAVLQEADFLDKDIQKRLKSLMMYDTVEFIACKNTLDSYKMNKKNLLNDVTIVTAGIVEIIERQLRGFIYVRP